MRVCMITSSYPRWEGDGAGSFVASLAQALAGRGHEIDIVAPYDPACAHQTDSGVNVHRFRYAPADELHIAGHGRALEADRRLKALAPALMPGFMLAATREVNRVQKAHPIDVLHGHWAVPGGVIAGWAARRRKLPLVISLHGSDVFVIEKSTLYARAARFGFRHAQHVAACSQDLRNRTVAVGLESTRSSVIAYGVDVERFGSASRDETMALRSKLDIAPDAPIVGAMGRLVAKKGFRYLIEAMALVHQQYPTAHCVIGGEGDLHNELQAQIGQSGLGDCVHLMGHVEWTETPAFYALCDIMAVPSVIDSQGNVDGLPNVLLEAMASGTAMVATRVAGIPDTISSGENGLLCPQRDARALSIAICELLSDQHMRDRLGDAAQQTMVDAFGWDRAAAAYETLYMNAIDEAGHEQ